MTSENKVRTWKIKVQHIVSGHNDFMPAYTLPYEGWEMLNPPEFVVEKCEFDSVVAENNSLADQNRNLQMVLDKIPVTILMKASQEVEGGK